MTCASDPGPGTALRIIGGLLTIALLIIAIPVSIAFAAARIAGGR